MDITSCILISLKSFLPLLKLSVIGKSNELGTIGPISLCEIFLEIMGLFMSIVVFLLPNKMVL